MRTCFLRRVSPATSSRHSPNVTSNGTRKSDRDQAQPKKQDISMKTSPDVQSAEVQHEKSTSKITGNVTGPEQAADDIQTESESISDGAIDGVASKSESGALNHEPTTRYSPATGPKSRERSNSQPTSQSTKSQMKPTKQDVGAMASYSGVKRSASVRQTQIRDGSAIKPAPGRSPLKSTGSSSLNTASTNTSNSRATGGVPNSRTASRTMAPPPSRLQDSSTKKNTVSSSPRLPRTPSTTQTRSTSIQSTTPSSRLAASNAVPLRGFSNPTPVSIRSTHQQSRQTSATTTPVKPQQRPGFNTYQQRYLDAREVKASANKGQRQSQRSIADIRLDTHLLHQHLLHTSSIQTYQQWTRSAYTTLHQRFRKLQQQYESVLRAKRAQRQTTNLLALHHWSGGNMVSLTRKLNNFTQILAELDALTSSGDSTTSEPPGAYTQLISQYERWIAWVRSIWAERDHAAKNDEEPTTFTQIEALGDSAKASLRTQLASLNALALRLEELNDPPIPSHAVAAAQSASASASSGTPARRKKLPPRTPPAQTAAPPPLSTKRSPAPITASAPEPSTPSGHAAAQAASPASDSAPDNTPAVLLARATALVHGMREELQTLREIEFEVVEGEKAWLEERLRRIAGDIEGGLGGGGGVGSPFRS